jgi:hypothetical protein
VKALRVIGCSLNDGKLMSAVEKIISGQIANNGKRVYELLALWAAHHFNLYDLIGKISAAVRRTLVLLVF